MSGIVTFIPIFPGEHHGTLCIMQASRSYFEPVETHLHYPIGPCWRQDAEYLLGQRVERNTCDPSGGAYVVRLEHGHKRDLRLKDGGKTLPLLTQTFDVERPKSRLPLRWNNEAWEKSTAKGWQVVPGPYKTIARQEVRR